MKRTIAVHLGDRGPIAELRHDAEGRREHAAFAYSNGWLQAADRFPIDPELPLVLGFQLHAHTPGGRAVAPLAHKESG